VGGKRGTKLIAGDSGEGSREKPLGFKKESLRVITARVGSGDDNPLAMVVGEDGTEIDETEEGGGAIEVEAKIVVGCVVDSGLESCSTRDNGAMNADRATEKGDAGLLAVKRARTTEVLVGTRRAD
jgi:hypothetical protein